MSQEQIVIAISGTDVASLLTVLSLKIQCNEK